MRYLLLIKLQAIFFTSLAQYSIDDIEISIEGFNNEMEMKFEGALPVLIESLNSQGITPYLTELKVLIKNDQSLSFIRLTGQLDSTKYLEEGRYASHQSSWESYGEGVSVYLIHELFTAITKFKFEAAYDGFHLNLEMMSFLNAVRLLDNSNNWVLFYSSNKIDRSGIIPDFPYHFYNQINLSVDGNELSLTPSNYKGFNEFKFVWTDSVMTDDGIRTPSFYFLKFFDQIDE